MYAEDPDLGKGAVAVLYGRDHQMPDSESMESLYPHGFDPPQGIQGVLFKDLTGDGICELVRSDAQLISVYIGLKGQRLLEQYGSGDDPPQPDSARWWGKPWAKIRGPSLQDDYWYPAAGILFDIGDWDGDSIADLATFSAPWMIVYHTGQVLDEKIDLLADLRETPGHQDEDWWSFRWRRCSATSTDRESRATRLRTGGGVGFLKPHAYEGWYPGTPRELPPGTGKPTSAVRTTRPRSGAALLDVRPNPSGGAAVRIRWEGLSASGGTVRITDETGRVIYTRVVGTASGSLLWERSEAARGSYRASLSDSSGLRASTEIVLR